MLIEFPTLYQKTNTGAIQSWRILVSDDDRECPIIKTLHGQVGGKIQSTIDIIKEGKNTGKANATSAREQAIKEAEAKWTKQKKKGYVESIEDAQNDKVDAIIEGGIAPMLAQSFSKHAAKITYPAYAQRKYDGIRCIAIVKDGKCTLWSRTRKPILGVPHIARELERLFPKRTLIWDGELYQHSYKDNFEQIVSYVRQDTPKPGHEVVEYHIYDFPSFKEEFCVRAEAIGNIFATGDYKQEESPVKLVETDTVKDEDQLMEYFDQYTKEGYEGLMVRNANGLYEEDRRSYGLQKVKEFLDAEWPVVDAEEGRGKLAGHVGAFVCQMTDGRTFKAKLMGDTAKLKEYFENPSLWKDKQLTVKYQNLTKDGIPRFPVAVRFRDYE